MDDEITVKFIRDKKTRNVTVTWNIWRERSFVLKNLPKETETEIIGMLVAIYTEKHRTLDVKQF